MNQKILITGGTSGLGKALAQQWLRLGARVAVVARGSGGLEALAHWAREQAIAEGALVLLQADISDKRQMHRIAGEALARLGGIDVLVNNASALGPTPLRPLLDTECEDFESVLQANLLGPFRLTKALLPSMALQRRGVVVNISSDAAVSAYPGWGAYGVSKAALDHLSRIWQEELRDFRVRFLAVDPGDMDTPMHRAALPDADPTTLKKPEQAAGALIQWIARLSEKSPDEPVRRALP